MSRDRNIYQDRKLGMTLKAVGAKYGLTAPAVYKIVKKLEPFQGDPEARDRSLAQDAHAIEVRRLRDRISVMTVALEATKALLERITQ